MIDFIKALMQRRGRSITVVILDEEQAGGPKSYTLLPSQLIPLVAVTAFLLVALTWLLLVFTPLGVLVYNRKDHQLREGIYNLGRKVVALDDSLEIRARQLRDIKSVIIGEKDTTFPQQAIAPLPEAGAIQTKKNSVLPVLQTSDETTNVFDKRNLIYGNILTSIPVFPTEMPVDGMVTRGFEPAEGHYGIDIATREGEVIHAVADGVVMNTIWSINYGYVIYVQHGGGYVTIYKHCLDLGKQEGDVVLKGDVLARVGKTGILTSGPHVHMELWHNGIALDPAKYLITK